MTKISVAVLASGRGSNFKAIQEAILAGRCNAEIKVLITNKADAPAIGIAKRHGIPVEIIERKKFKSREEMDEKIKELLDRYGAGLVVLAGYMLVLKSKNLLEAYKNKIINNQIYQNSLEGVRMEGVDYNDIIGNMIKRQQRKWSLVNEWFHF